MSEGLILSRCGNCGMAFFPARLLCPNCGADQWRAEDAGEGVIEETTTVRQAAGHGEWQPRQLATVRLDSGPVIIAGIDRDYPPQTRVTVTASGGAALAAPTQSRRPARPRDPVARFR